LKADVLSCRIDPLVVRAVPVDQTNAADRELSAVEPAEHLDDLVGPTAVHDQPAVVRLAVESDVHEAHETQVPKTDGTPLVPRAPRHQLPGLAVQTRDRGHERLAATGADGSRNADDGHHDRHDQQGAIHRLG
jgi:hypothetical protein